MSVDLPKVNTNIPILTDITELPNDLPVRCRKSTGTLFVHKLGNGSSGKCILTDGLKGVHVTPVQFEILSGLKRISIKNRKSFIVNYIDK